MVSAQVAVVAALAVAGIVAVLAYTQLSMDGSGAAWDNSGFSMTMTTDGGDSADVSVDMASGVMVTRTAYTSAGGSEDFDGEHEGETTPPEGEELATPGAADTDTGGEAWTMSTTLLTYTGPAGKFTADWQEVTVDGQTYSFFSNCRENTAEGLDEVFNLNSAGSGVTDNGDGTFDTEFGTVHVTAGVITGISDMEGGMSAEVSNFQTGTDGMIPFPMECADGPGEAHPENDAAYDALMAAANQMAEADGNEAPEDGERRLAEKKNRLEEKTKTINTLLANEFMDTAEGQERKASMWAYAQQFVNEYWGNWCGPNNAGGHVWDVLDACCHRHDTDCASSTGTGNAGASSSSHHKSTPWNCWGPHGGKCESCKCSGGLVGCGRWFAGWHHKTSLLAGIFGMMPCWVPGHSCTGWWWWKSCSSVTVQYARDNWYWMWFWPKW
jgi:hypothetical protein